MSARTYKLELQRVTGLLAEQITSAREWQKVAENRLKIIEFVDTVLNEQVGKLLKIGTIFGVDPTDPGLPKADSRAHSGDEMVRLVLLKIKAVSSFTSSLTREAAELQSVLSDTLTIALQSHIVPRPTVDIHLSETTGVSEDATSPLQEVYDQIEDDASGLDDHPDDESPPLELVRYNQTPPDNKELSGLFN